MTAAPITGYKHSARSPLLRPFYPALDGLRAFAVILVLSLHFGFKVWWTPMMRWAWVGVDLFFVLSGFLITGILFDSLGSRAYFRVFYTRRALRIFPLYYGFWLVLLLLTPLFHFEWNAYVLSTVLYLGNLFASAAATHPASTLLVYHSVFHPLQQHGLSFGHLWSLCVEEQFYLVWPGVVFLLGSRKSLLRVCLAAIVLLPCMRAVVVFRFPQLFVGNDLYVNTLARTDTLLIGAALALWLRGPSPQPATLRRWARVLVVAAPALLLVLSVGRRGYGFSSFSEPLIATVGYTLVGIASASLLLLAIIPGSRTSRLLQWRPFTRIGRVSYGMYFLHGLLVDFVAGKVPLLQRYHLGLVSPLLCFAITFLLAELSFRYLESPFLRLKERLAARPGAVADPPAAGVPLHRETRYVRNRGTAVGTF